MYTRDNVRAVPLPPEFRRREFDPYSVLEAGDILVIPQALFPQTDADREFLLGVQPSKGQYHKNIAYRPRQDRISGFGKMETGPVERLRSILRVYSQQAIAFLGELLPRYEPHWRLDYASLRPVEESGRDLPFKKRNDMLHVDAFPTRPTNGGLILRFFTNVHPTKRRVWITSDPIEAAAARYAQAAGLDRVARSGLSGLVRSMMRRAGLPFPKRSPYDDFMLGFHDYLKRNADYQRTCPKYRFEFAPSESWLVFTDIVPHSVESGQLALEQTMIIDPGSLASPERSPVRILEKIAGRPLTWRANTTAH